MAEPIQSLLLRGRRRPDRRRHIFAKPSRTEPGFPYRVVEVITEHLMVVENIESPVPGQGVVKPGFHVFMLTEHGQTSVATILMQHASLMANKEDDLTEEEALAAWHHLGAEGVKKWRDSFIPTFRRLVDEL